MIQNDDGTIICEGEEILNNKIKVLENPFLLSEYQFHVLIENKDTQVDDYASKIFLRNGGTGTCFTNNRSQQ